MGLSHVQEGSRVGVIEKEPQQDRVEISDLAKLLSEMEPNTKTFRVDKVMAIREAIANGTYETEGKLQITIERLLDELHATEPV